MIATPLTELLGVGVPLISAPMTPQAGGLLARAVSEAGAFGMVGIEETDTEEGIAAELAIVRAGTPVPFGIGLVSWVIDRRPELLDIAIDAKPTLISISFGDAGPHVERLHDAGILVASQVQSRHRAEVAIGAGVDIVVAQGTEGGGHTGSVATLPLLQIVLELTGLPVVAAGGIASGRGLAAVLAAGAVGAWAGTPFLLAEEARNSLPRANGSPAATRPKRSTRASTTGCRTRAGPRSSVRGRFGTRSAHAGRGTRTSLAPAQNLVWSSSRPGRPRTTTSRTSMPGSRSACSTPFGQPQRSSLRSRRRRASSSGAGSRRRAGQCRRAALTAAP